MTYSLVPCCHKALCESCGDFGRFFDEGRRPLSTCPVCGVEMEEPYLVRGATLEGYHIYCP